MYSFTTQGPSCTTHAATSKDPQEHVRPTAKNRQNDRLFEKIGFVAISIFAMMTSPILFIGAAVVGIAVHSSRKEEHAESFARRPEDVFHKGYFACGSSLLERLADVKLPSSLAVTANVAVLLAHIKYLSPAFVPIVGVITGLWLGKNFGQSAISTVDLYFRQVIKLVSEQLHKLHKIQ